MKFKYLLNEDVDLSSNSIDKAVKNGESRLQKFGGSKGILKPSEETKCDNKNAVNYANEGLKQLENGCKKYVWSDMKQGLIKIAQYHSINNRGDDVYYPKEVELIKQVEHPGELISILPALKWEKSSSSVRRDAYKIFFKWVKGGYKSLMGKLFGTKLKD